MVEFGLLNDFDRSNDTTVAIGTPFELLFIEDLFGVVLELAPRLLFNFKFLDDFDCVLTCKLMKEYLSSFSEEGEGNETFEIEVIEVRIFSVSDFLIQ